MQNPAKITSSPTILNMKGREERVGGIFEQVLSNNFLSRALPEIKNQRKEKRSTLVGKFRRVSISSVKDNSSSDDGCNKLSDALPAFRKLNINSESGSVSMSSTFDELDQPYSRKSQGSLDSQDHHLNKSDFQQDKKEGFGRRLSFSPPLCVQRTNDSHQDYIDHDASSDSRQVSLPSLPLSASSSCRNSAQSSPSRLRSSRLGSPKHSRRVPISAVKPVDDVSNLNQQLLDALQRGGFTESYSIEKPNISPSLTPLRSPSPSRIPLHSKLKVSLPPDSIALFTPDHLLSTNGLGSVKVNTLAKSPGGRNTAARRSHSIYLLPGSRGGNGKIDKVAETFAELTNKMDCNLAKEEMIVRSDERQRRRSEILSRRVVRTGSTAVATLNACLDVQKKFDEISLKDKTEKSESRRKFWMKVVSALSVAELLVHDLPARLISYRRSKHLRKCSQIILRLFLNHRKMRFQLIKKILSVHIEKGGGKGELKTVAEILTPLVSLLTMIMYYDLSIPFILILYLHYSCLLLIILTSSLKSTYIFRLLDGV
jgi:hypothetical protein